MDLMEHKKDGEQIRQRSRIVSVLSHIPVRDKNQLPLTQLALPACHPGPHPLSHMLLFTHTLLCAHLYTLTFLCTHLCKIM